MRFAVNDKCIACGLCEAVCPEVFTLDGDKAQAKQGDITGSVKEGALEAMHGCPVAAIEEKD